MPASLRGRPKFLPVVDGPRSRSALGQTGIINFYRRPVHNLAWTISGITRDSTGAVLGGCTVELFYTATDVKFSSTVSNSTTGVYTFQLPTNNLGMFYAVAYLAGSPDVAGTTMNTLEVQSAIAPTVVVDDVSVVVYEG